MEQYLSYNTRYNLNFDYYFKNIVEVNPTDIVHKNGTIQTIYEVGSVISEKR